MKLAIGNSQGHHHQHVRVLTISLKRTFLHLVKYPLSLVLHQLTPSLCQRTEIGAISSGSTSKMSLTKRRKTIKANYFQAPQMQHALGSALSSLPGETLVYCGHEYSLQVWTKRFVKIKFVIFAVKCFNQDWWNLFLPLHALSFSAHSAILFGTKFAISQLSQSQFISLKNWNSFLIDRTLHLELMWNHRTR